MEAGDDVLHVIAGPVVDRADPFDAESRTVDLARPGAVGTTAAAAADPLVPPAGAGVGARARRAGGVLRRSPVALTLVAAAAVAPTHFFAGRVDDTVVAAPALVELAGGFGLLLLPVMWLAYVMVAALPSVLCLAGAVGVAVPAAARGRTPGFATVWRLVAYRLRPLWLWLAGFGVVTQALPILLTADGLGASVAAPLAVVLALAATAVLTVTGMLGCVVLVERGGGPRRAVHLLSRAPTGALVGAALATTVLPRVAESTAGPYAATAVGVATGLGWAVTALVTYAQARRSEGPVTSVSLRAELAAPEVW